MTAAATTSPLDRQFRQLRAGSNLSSSARTDLRLREQLADPQAQLGGRGRTARSMRRATAADSKRQASGAPIRASPRRGFG